MVIRVFRARMLSRDKDAYQLPAPKYPNPNLGTMVAEITNIVLSSFLSISDWFIDFLCPSRSSKFYDFGYIANSQLIKLLDRWSAIKAIIEYGQFGL